MKISVPLSAVKKLLWVPVAIQLLTGCNKTSQKVTLLEKDCPLDVVFRKIEEQTGYYFIYREEWLRTEKTININVKDEPLNKVVSKCLANCQVTFSIIDKLIVIKKKMV